MNSLLIIKFKNVLQPVLENNAKDTSTLMSKFFMMKNFKVVLNISGKSVVEIIQQARFYVTNTNNNPVALASCAGSAAKMTAAADDVDAALLLAADKGKSATALVRDKESVLVDAMYLHGANVQDAAKGDPAIVHLAGMELKKPASRTKPEFKITQGANHGTVALNVKARKNTMYKWQYSLDPATAAWTDAGTASKSKTVITTLTQALYWFRVIFIDEGGEHAEAAVSFAVN